MVDQEPSGGWPLPTKSDLPACFAQGALIPTELVIRSDEIRAGPCSEWSWMRARVFLRWGRLSTI